MIVFHAELGCLSSLVCVVSLVLSCHVRQPRQDKTDRRPHILPISCRSLAEARSSDVLHRRSDVLLRSSNVLLRSSDVLHRSNNVLRSSDVLLRSSQAARTSSSLTVNIYWLVQKMRLQSMMFAVHSQLYNALFICYLISLVAILLHLNICLPSIRNVK